MGTQLPVPNGYYDRQKFTPTTTHTDWRMILFNPSVAIQSAELNELQSVQQYQFASLANALFQDGTFLTAVNITSVFDGTDYTVTIPAGQVFSNGFIHDVPQLGIDITGVGIETVQLVITEVVTSGVAGKPSTVYDATLLDPVVNAENYGYAGADRLKFSYALELNGTDGPTIATFNNGQLVPTTPNLTLAQLLQLLQTYFFETLGSYVTTEPALTFSDLAALTTNPPNLQLVIAGGTGYVKGVRYVNTSATLTLARPMTGQNESGEPHTYTTGTSIYTVNQTPLLNTSVIQTLRQSPTLTITKGAADGTDNIPSQYRPVSSIVSVVQSSTTYVAGVDYNQVGDAIHWIHGGGQPTTGTSYSVVVQYIYNMVKAVRTLTSVASEDHTYTSGTLALTHADVSSLTSLVDTTASVTLVLGTDFTIALNTGVVTFINPPVSGHNVRANYAYWAHTVEGDYIARDSFVNGSSVIQYFITPILSPNGNAIDYKSQICFQTTTNNLPINSSVMFFTYQFTIGRIDYLAWHSDGTFKILQGTPAISPAPPSFTVNDMPVSSILLPPECVAAGVVPTNYPNLAISEVGLNQMKNEIAVIDNEIIAINSNITTLFAGIPYFVVDVNNAQSPYSLSNLYAVYVIDASAGNVVINLPQMISGFRANLVFIRKDNSNYTVTITPYGSQTILGAANLGLNQQWLGQTIYPDSTATNWVSGNNNAANFGASANWRPCPTSGTITGDYFTTGNWTQTGPITSNQARLFFSGNVTINNAWTINTEIPGGKGIATAGVSGSGAWLGGGGGAYTDSSSLISGGGGGGHGGVGGAGSVTQAGVSGVAIAASNGGAVYPLNSLLAGSGGGGGSASGPLGGVGGDGGSGGGSLYIETPGTIHLTSSAAMTADGGAGVSQTAGNSTGGGGGSGGGIEFRSLSAITIDASATVYARGGVGGNGATTGSFGGRGGGGGGGGIIDMAGNSSSVNNGTLGVGGASGGTAADTSSGGNGFAGSTGVVVFSTTVKGKRTVN